MEKLITMETLRSFCYVNDAVCTRPIRGIVIQFVGLGTDHMQEEDCSDGIRYGKDGYLYVIPYVNPWSWMNRQTIDYVDELTDVLIQGFSLPDDIPLAYCGGSMGGMAALTYTRYAKRTPRACVVNCPVCDLPYHYTERPDLPRTLYSAYGLEDGTLEEVLRRYSPLHLAPEMPRIHYAVFHCEQDEAVNKQRHGDAFVSAMQACGQDVDYVSVPDRGHCNLTPEAWSQYHVQLKSALGGK